MANSVKQCMERFARGLAPVEGLDDVTRFLAFDDCEPATIIATDGRSMVLDLSPQSRMLDGLHGGMDVAQLSELIDDAMRADGTAFAFGRYAESRALYNNANFASTESGESRTVHLGIDLFCVSGTAVHAPLDADVAIIANNQLELDYGPMLVLRHRAGRRTFFSLYGHLDLESLAGLHEGQAVSRGELIAAVGSPPQNGNWPPHLHFQLLVDLLELGKDFPGVAYASQRDFWLTLSPSPARFFPECDATLLQAPTPGKSP